MRVESYKGGPDIEPLTDKSDFIVRDFLLFAENNFKEVLKEFQERRLV